jgi:hypothetical protein
MMNAGGLSPVDCKSKRLSPFKAIWRIGTLRTERQEKPHNGGVENPGEGTGDDNAKKGEPFDPEIILAPLRLAEGLSYAGEAGALLAILILIIYAISGGFFLWMFISIPLMLFILSALTLGDAWRYLIIYRIDMEYPGRESLGRMVRYIFSRRGLVSENVLAQLADRNVRESMRRLIGNQKSFVLCVAVTSYSCFFLGLIELVDKVAFDMGDDFVVVAWLFLGLTALVGFSMSVYYLVVRRLIVLEAPSMTVPE